MSKATESSAQSTKVSINLNGRPYSVACDVGQERRLNELATYIDGKMKEVGGKANGASDETRFMLTCLMLADELFETKRLAAKSALAEEDLMIAAVNHLTQRVATIAQQVGRA